jgi:predicted peroxiredoxin
MTGEAGKSLFLQFFGDKPKFRIIDFMLENRLQDFTKTEIAKGAGLSWASLFSHWDDMEKKKIVKLTRIVGRAKLYQLNEKSHLVMLLKNLEMTLIKEAADAAEEEVSMKVKVRIGTRK